MGGEGDGLRVEGDLLAPAHVALHDGLRAIVEDLVGDPAEVGEGADVAPPEAGQVAARHEAAERVTAVAQRHVEAVDVDRARLGLEDALVAPVHLGLGPGEHFEASV